MSRIILFNADDWGLSQGIHDSIVSLHRKRAIDAAGIMMGQKFTNMAVAYAKANPELRVGLHLFATDRDCKPLGRDRWPFGWPEDLFINTAMVLPHVQSIALGQVRAQLKAYHDTGLPLHFVNGHFHFHAHKDFSDQAIAAIHESFPDFKGWVRFGDSKPYPGSLFARGDLLFDLIEKHTFKLRWAGRCNDTLWGMSSTFENEAKQVATTAKLLGDGFHEFFFHPGRAQNLNSNGRDHAALMELVTHFPKSYRNLPLISSPPAPTRPCLKKKRPRKPPARCPLPAVNPDRTKSRTPRRKPCSAMN